MSGPLIFISHSTVRPGKLDEYKLHSKEAVDLIESSEPRMIGFSTYASDDGTEVSTVQVHPDAESLDTHLALFSEKLSQRAFAALNSHEINVYGTPSDAALEMLRQLEAQMPDLKVRVQPVYEGGFLRPQPL